MDCDTEYRILAQSNFYYHRSNIEIFFQVMIVLKKMPQKSDTVGDTHTF